MKKELPACSQGIIDSHAHLVREYFPEDREEILDRASSSGVSALVNPGVSLEDVEEISEIAQSRQWIFAAAGQHPHEANKWSEESPERLERALAHDKFVAVGECGLDFHYNHSDRDTQLRVFREQVRIARKLAKPVIVHCRDAWSEAIEILQSEGKGEIKGVFHCFTGNKDILPDIKRLDFYISYSGILTFKNAVEIQETAPLVPGERFLVETDCPYLAPQAVRGNRNEPSYVWWVAEKLAELRKISLEEVAGQASENARSLFSLPDL